MWWRFLKSLVGLLSVVIGGLIFLCLTQVMVDLKILVIMTVGLVGVWFLASEGQLEPENEVLIVLGLGVMLFINFYAFDWFFSLRHNGPDGVNDVGLIPLPFGLPNYTIPRYVMYDLQRLLIYLEVVVGFIILAWGMSKAQQKAQVRREG